MQPPPRWTLTPPQPLAPSTLLSMDLTTLSISYTGNHSLRPFLTGFFHSVWCPPGSSMLCACLFLGLNNTPFKCTPHFSSINPVVLASTFRPVTHFELIFFTLGRSRTKVRCFCTWVSDGPGITCWKHSHFLTELWALLSETDWLSMCRFVSGIIPRHWSSCTPFPQLVKQDRVSKPGHLLFVSSKWFWLF